MRIIRDVTPENNEGNLYTISLTVDSWTPFVALISYTTIYCIEIFHYILTLGCQDVQVHELPEDL